MKKEDFEDLIELDNGSQQVPWILHISDHYVHRSPKIISIETLVSKEFL